LGFPRHEWRGYYQKSLQDFVLLKSKPVLFINFFPPMNQRAMVNDPCEIISCEDQNVYGLKEEKIN